MSKKQLIILTIVLGLLICILLLKESAKSPVNLEEQMALETFAPSGFLSSDAARIEIYKRESQDQKVVLARTDGSWRVRSRFNAPAKGDKIDNFLDKMKTLEGEFRSREAAVLEDYGISEDKALHIAVYRKNEKKPSYHILVGKRETYGRRFVRRQGQNTVYTVNVDLASEIGLWGDTDNAPESSQWMDKVVVDFDKEKITKIALTTPDNSRVFEKRAKGPVGEEPETGEKEYEWVLAEDNSDAVFQQSEVDGILRALDIYYSLDVADPSKKKEFGLESPGFRCEVTLENGEKTALIAARNKPDEDGYMMIEGKDTVYTVTGAKLDDLFGASEAEEPPEIKKPLEIKKPAETKKPRRRR